MAHLSCVTSAARALGRHLGVGEVVGIGMDLLQGGVALRPVADSGGHAVHQQDGRRRRDDVGVLRRWRSCRA